MIFKKIVILFNASVHLLLYKVSHNYRSYLALFCFIILNNYSVSNVY